MTRGLFLGGRVAFPWHGMAWHVGLGSRGMESLRSARAARTLLDQSGTEPVSFVARPNSLAIIKTQPSQKEWCSGNDGTVPLHLKGDIRSEKLS